MVYTQCVHVESLVLSCHASEVVGDVAVVLCLLSAASIVERMKECLVKHAVKQDLKVLCVCVCVCCVLCVHVCVCGVCVVCGACVCARVCVCVGTLFHIQNCECTKVLCIDIKDSAVCSGVPTLTVHCTTLAHINVTMQQALF